MGRMSLLGVSGGLAQAWTPASLANLAAWYYAAPDYITLSGSEVTVWEDRSGNGNDVDGVSGALPDYVEDGWDTGHDVINFDGAEVFSHPSFVSSEVDFSGSDQPFSVLLTIEANGDQDMVIVEWAHSAGSARSLVRTDNTGSGRLRYDRRDDAASAVAVGGTVNLGTAKLRLAVIFHGTTVSLYVNETLDTDQAACNVGTATFNRLRIGTGPVVDGFVGDLQEVVIVGRAITAEEWAAYYAYSVGSLGS